MTDTASDDHSENVSSDAHDTLLFEKSNDNIKDEELFSNCPNESFKVPVSIGSKLKPPKVYEENVKNSKNETVVNETKNKPVLPIPYQEPEWGCKPSAVYSLEVLKNGQIVTNIDLREKSFSVFGRMESCDIVLEHPSVSRYHAVLQYRDNEEKGFYIYDLESTHGTFLNKKQLRPRTYYKMHVGHMVKLGGSTRIYILQGPPEDEEEEDELSVTELKVKRKALEKAAQAKTHQEGGVGEPTAEDGIDWGFGEDATEDPVTENPFAVSAPNEDLYLDDPKKTLRGWFEREGYDLEYKVEEKGFGHFSCQIELPIDSASGEAVFAEASVKGKKKEAVIAAALEACRILDRHGVLRQSQHDSRKRKEKDWESQDFYDSEEDTYLDRTGTIERKRQLRKKMVKKDDNVETYDSLMSKLKETENEIAEVQKRLEQANKAVKPADEASGDQDSLEAFMANLKNIPSVDKKAKSQLNLQLSALMQEKLRLHQLVKIARPTVLPPLETTPVKDPNEAQKSLIKKLMPMTGAIRGKVIGKGTKISKILSNEVNKKVDKKDDEDKVEAVVVVEEEEEEEEEEVEDAKAAVKEKDQDACSKEKLPLLNADVQHKEVNETVDTQMDVCNDQTVNKPAVLGPVWSSEEKTKEEKKKRQRKPNHRKAKLDSSNPDYSMWLPPDNQTGDGKTHLNDKFGY